MPANDAVVSLRTLTGDENVLLLAPCPGDEVFVCGGLIAEACARGRPPYVVILTDGSSGPGGAAASERAARRAALLLGLPSARLLMTGIYDGTVPLQGPAFAALVRAIILVMWARDCNVICVPWPDAVADRRAAARLAEAVADEIGIPLLYAATGEHCLDAGQHADALRKAHRSYVDEAPLQEKFLLLFSKRSPSLPSCPLYP